MTIRNGFATVFAMLVAASVFAQESVAPEEDREKFAMLSFANACSTDLTEPWKASVDIYYNNTVVVSDLRIGESSILRKIDTGQPGNFEVKEKGGDKVLATLPANPRPGSFATLVLVGSVGSQSNVQILPLRDHPLKPEQISKDMARLVIVPGISDYPNKFVIGQKELGNLKFGVPVEIFFPAGEHEIKMFFRDAKLGPDELNTSSGLLAKAGATTNLIFFDSPQLPGRPRVLVLDATQQRQDFLDAREAEQKEGEIPE